MEALMLALLLLAAVLVSSVIDQLVPKISSPLIQILLGLGIALLASSQIKIELDDKLFLVLFMALGLLIRPLMANVNRMVARQVRDGGLFNGEDVDIPVRPYRISQIMRALSDKDTYATALQQRYATFNRWYPRLMKGALVLGVAVPVVLAVIFALTPTEKVWLLTGWLIWIIVIFVALVVIESLRFSFERQLKLESLSDASLIDLYGATADVERAACMDARDAGFGGREHESDRDGARDGAEGEEARHE